MPNLKLGFNPVENRFSFRIIKIYHWLFLSTLVKYDQFISFMLMGRELGLFMAICLISFKFPSPKDIQVNGGLFPKDKTLHDARAS